MNPTAERLKSIASEARAAGFRGASDILKRMSRDVDAGKIREVLDEIDAALRANYRRREPVDAHWEAAQRACADVVYPRHREPEAPPVYVTMADLDDVWANPAPRNPRGGWDLR